MKSLRHLMPIAVAGATLAASPVAVTAPPNVSLDFDSAVPGSILDAQGEGTGFTHLLTNSDSDPAVAAQLDLKTADSELLVTASRFDARSNFHTNWLATQIDGSAPFQVETAIAGPLTLFDAPFENAGIFVGPDMDRYVKLVVGREEDNTTVQLAYEDGTELGPVTPVSRLTVPNAGAIGEISLRIDVDPASNEISGSYSADGGSYNPVGSVTVPGIAGSPTKAGLSHTRLQPVGQPENPAFQIPYRSFDVQPAPAGSQFSFAPRKVVVDESIVPGFVAPTAIQVSDDGSRLYVAEQLGRIHVLDLDSNNDATLVQTITAIRDYGNRDFQADGTLAPSPQWVQELGRRVTGIDVVEEGAGPVIYVSHSDPRNNENKEPGQARVDPTSGVVTRLSGPNFATATDLVRGLPRSAEHHGPNGMSIKGGWLYVSLGGNTNHGLQSKTFGYYPETLLSASIVRLKLSEFSGPGDVIDASSGSDFRFTEPCADGQSVGAGCSADTEDPTPGADPTVGGTFEGYADGFRNGYDLAWHSNGGLYLNDNGGNNGFGLAPLVGCSGSTNPGDEADQLFRVQAGAYHGHPNPARNQCDWGGGVQSIGTYGASTSTNGIVEYTSGIFGGALQGDLISANFAAGDNVVHAKLSPDGQSVVEQGTIASSLLNPIDVATDSGGDLFVAEYGDYFNPDFSITDSTVAVFEPQGSCTVLGGANDSDGDGISDENELAAGTDPCNGADVPDDLDGDGVPDVIDDDIDGDGLPNAADDYQLDPDDGKKNVLPIELTFDLSGPGFFGSGFPGVQRSSNGGGPSEGQIGVGGAGGFMQFRATEGTMVGAANNQDNALQIGIPAQQDFTASALVSEPFQNLTAPAGQTAAALFFGPGEDDFARVAISADDGSPIVELGVEKGGNYTRVASIPLPPGTAGATLILQGRPSSSQVIAKYAFGSGDPQTLGVVDVPAGWFTAIAPIGLTATKSGNPGDDVSFIFQDFSVVAGADGAPDGGTPGTGTGQPGAGSGAPATGAPAAGSAPSVCGPVPPAPAKGSGSGGKVTPSAGQLLINQRISQAAVRRTNAIQAWLDGGIEGRDFCGGSLTAADFGPGVTIGQAGASPSAAPSPRPLSVAGPKKGKGASVEFTTAQLRINQRISQAAVRRANALAARIESGLTGGDVKDGSIGPGLLASGVGISASQPASQPPAASKTVIAPAKPSRNARFSRSSQQLLVNQKISQAAVRRANALAALIERGLTGEEIRDGSLTAVDLDASLR